MTTNRMTRSQVETMLTPLKNANSYGDSAESTLRDAVNKVIQAINDGYNTAEETDELRRQLKKALRRAVELEVQLEIAETRLASSGAPMIMVTGGFIVGPRDELQLEHVLPGFPVIFTDPPKPVKIHERKMRPNIPGSEVPMKHDSDER